MKYKSLIEGPLILKMNINSKWTKNNPSGALNIKIKGAKLVEKAEELDTKLGWCKSLKVIRFVNKQDLPEYTIPKNEKKIIILLNKARYDPKLFANQYLTNFKSLTPSSEKIYNEFLVSFKNISYFKINVSIVKLLRKFFEPFFSENLNSFNNITTEKNDAVSILNSGKAIKNYLNECFNNIKTFHYVNVIKYKTNNAFHVVSRLLFDDDARKNIFNVNCEEISMITLSSKEKNAQGNSLIDVYYTVFVFSDSKGNDNINYNLSQNIKQFLNVEKTKSNESNIVKMIKINTKPIPSILTLGQKNDKTENKRDKITSTGKFRFYS